MPLFRRIKAIKKPFLLFLASQGISGLGDAFQFIAITTHLVNIGGSGFSAGLGIIYSILPSIFLSPFAGSLGDRLSVKKMMIVIDILRGIIVTLFVSNHNIPLIYLLMVLLSSLDVIYNPPRKKLIASILERKEYMSGNSLYYGVSGIAFMIGPIAAGFMVGAYGADFAFLFNSLSFFISAVIIFFIGSKSLGLIKKPAYKKRSSVIADMKSGFRYFNITKSIKQIVLTITAIGFCGTSITIAFYPYAFDTLRLTSQGWGVMMSIYYGTNLIAMVLALYINKMKEQYVYPAIYISLLLVAACWMSYWLTASLLAVLIFQLIEGIAAGLYGILLGTKLQLASSKDYMARVFGINDVINNAAKMLSMVFTYTAIMFIPLRSIFMINSLLLGCFAAYRMISPPTSQKQA